jgi:hypothetical protein
MGDGVLEILFETVPGLEGQRADLAPFDAEFGDERVGHVEGCCELLDQRWKKLLAGLRLYTFDDFAQHCTGLRQIARARVDKLFQSFMGLPERLLRLLQFRHVAGEGEEFLRLSVFVEDGLDYDIPPARLIGLLRRKEADEPAETSLSRHLYRTPGGVPVITFTKSIQE